MFNRQNSGLSGNSSCLLNNNKKEKGYSNDNTKYSIDISQNGLPLYKGNSINDKSGLVDTTIYT
jgi:hypothetical protein